MRNVVWLHILCWSLAVGGAARAEQDPFNVDIYFGWGGCFRPTEWTPIEVGIGTFLDTPFSGQFQMALPQDVLNTLHIRHTLVLTPEIPVQIPLVGRMAFSTEACRFQLVNDAGRPVWSTRIPLLELPSDRVQVVQHNDLLIGVVGERRFGLLDLPDATFCHAEDEASVSQGAVYVRDKLPHRLPWDWTGYASLDLLIVYNPDASRLRSQQWQALADWVAKGGCLMWICGPQPWPGDNALTRQFPVTPGALKQIRLSPARLEDWGLSRGQPLDFSITPLQPQTDRDINIVEKEGDDVLRADFSVGFGRVAVLGYDPRQLADEFQDRSAAYWVRQAQALLAVPRRGALDVTVGGRSLRLNNGDRPDDHGIPAGMPQTQKANNQVMEHLYDIDQMRPLSVGWVIGLLILLAILIGPVDYWVLKKLDRQPLTWITCAGWIVLFTVGAYYGVQALRAGDLQLRVVSVTDSVPGMDTAWQTRYCGIFAPKSDDYALTGVDPGQWWSGLAPSPNYMNRIHMGGQYGRRDIYCLQQDGGNLPVSLPIGIWTMQCLQAESTTADLPLSVAVELSGENLRVHIENTSPLSFTRSALLFRGQRGLDLGPLPSGEARHREGRMRPLEDWWAEPGGRPRLDLTELFTARGIRERTVALEAYLEAGAGVLIMEHEADDASLGLTAPDCQIHHVGVRRQVVFPTQARIDG